MADQDKLLDHDYDGIQEYDNDLPLWWRNIFVVTTIFGIVYLIYMHGGFATSDHDKLQQELARLEAISTASSDSSGASTESSPEDLMALVSDTNVISSGKSVYEKSCVACHGMLGEGLVGPNLTDSHWIHGGKIEDIRRIIQEGVPEKGMIAWKAMLTSRDLDSVVAYLWTLQGSNPPNAKAPEGEPVE